MYKTYYKKGDTNAKCDGCNFYYKQSQLRKDWRGFMMCSKDWEEKHAQLEPIKLIGKEGEMVPDARIPAPLPPVDYPINFIPGTY